MTPTISTERLAQALTEERNPELVEMIHLARMGYFDTHKSKLENPTGILVSALREFGCERLAERVENGEFEGTAEEVQSQEDDDQAETEKCEAGTALNKETLEGGVWIRMGGVEQVISPRDVKNIAMGFLQAAINAELESKLAKWAVKNLGLSIDEALTFRDAFCESRHQSSKTTAVLIVDGKETTSEKALLRGSILIETAIRSQVSVKLTDFLAREVGLDADEIAILINELNNFSSALIQVQEQNRNQDDC